MISFPLFFVARALSFLSSFRILSFSVRTAHFHSLPYLFSFLRFWLLACVAVLFVSCAGGGGGSGGSDSRKPFELVDLVIDGMDGDYLEFRSAATFSFNVTCPPFCEEQEVLFFRSSTESISLQDDEIGRENVSLNISDNTQRLRFPFVAGLPGTYYYGVCIGAECSAGEEIIVAGLAVTSLVTDALRREGDNGDVFFMVEDDEELQLTATVSCFGPAVCPDINVSYYRALGNGMAELLETINSSLTLSNMTEDFPFTDDTGGYTNDMRYYGCLDPTIPSRAVSYGEDDFSCLAIEVRLDDDDGDGVSRSNDVDEDGDGLIEIGTAAELDAMRYVPDGSGYRPANGSVRNRGCPPAGCKGYELTADIDLASYERSADDSAAGWQPIGNVSAPFVAVFAGNNFTIRNLYINRPAEDRVGLFGRVGAGAELKDVRLAAVNVSGRDGVGGLVGNGADVTIITSSVTGMVNGTNSVGGLVGNGAGVTIITSSVTGMVNGTDSIGGLVGDGTNAMITASYVVGNVSGKEEVGGLVGDGTGATISASSVTGMVNGRNSIGGLVGNGFRATITASYVTEDVSGRNRVGGLVGFGEDAMITASYATGNVSGQDEVGGLVGDGGGAIINASSATGMVSGRNSVGGLVGDGEDAMITVSYAAGDVSGGNSVGGLVGDGTGATITASYAAGDLSGGNNVGGLVGDGFSSTITASYAAGDLSGLGDFGGLVGGREPTAVIDSYWDSDVSGRSSDMFGAPRRTVELQFPLAELRTAWEGQLCPGGAERAWNFGESYQYPALTCPPGGVAAQEEQRTLPAFVGFSPADIVSLAVADFGVEEANRTEGGVLVTAVGESLRLSALLSCAAGALCSPTEVRYYESTDAQVDTNDRLVGTSLSPHEGGSSAAAIMVAAGEDLIRYYGACVGDVCTAATKVVLPADVQVRSVRLVGTPSRVLRGGDNVTFSADIFCPGVCPVVDLSFYASADAVLDLTDEKIDEQGVLLAPEEMRTISLSFSVPRSGYYGVCTPTECFADSVVRIIINNLNDQDDGDGVAAAEDVDDDGDGLIEIRTADELNNTRFVLDGSGYRTGAVATKNMTGCPAAGCSGYELTAPIDLASYGRDYDNGSGWEPVGTGAAPFHGRYLSATTFLFTISISIVLVRTKWVSLVFLVAARSCIRFPWWI